MKENQVTQKAVESIEEFEETFLPAAAREKKRSSSEWEKFWKEAEKSLSVKHSSRSLQA
jgi:hypothetical protein